MRGRPASRTYLIARQVDLFPDVAYRAELEKRYPYLAAITALVSASIDSRLLSKASDVASAAPAARNAVRTAGAVLVTVDAPPPTNRGGNETKRHQGG